MEYPIPEEFFDHLEHNRYNSAFRSLNDFIHSRGYDVNSLRDDGLSVLHICALYGATPLFDYIVHTLDHSPNPLSDDGETPLSLAAASPDTKPETIFHLVQCGSSVNFRNANGRSALHNAALAGNVGTCKALLDCNADPDLVDSKNGWTAAFFSLIRPNEDVLHLLIDVGCDLTIKDKYNRSMLHYCASGDVNFLGCIAGCLDDESGEFVTGFSSSHVHADPLLTKEESVDSLFSCITTIVEALLAEDDATQDDKLEHMVISELPEEMRDVAMSTLRETHSSTMDTQGSFYRAFQPDNDGYSPLHHACASCVGYQFLRLFLISRSSQPCIKEALNSATLHPSFTPLMLSIMSGNRNSFRALIRSGANVKQCTSIGIFAHVLSYSNDPLAFLEDLQDPIAVSTLSLSSKFKSIINMPNSDSLTPLSLACKVGNLASVQLLLALGADPYLCVGSQGSIGAQHKESHDISHMSAIDRAYVAFDSVLPSDGMMCIHFAVIGGHSEIVSELLKWESSELGETWRNEWVHEYLGLTESIEKDTPQTETEAEVRHCSDPGQEDTHNGPNTIDISPEVEHEDKEILEKVEPVISETPDVPTSLIQKPRETHGDLKVDDFHPISSTSDMDSANNDTQGDFGGIDASIIPHESSESSLQDEPDNSADDVIKSIHSGEESDGSDGESSIFPSSSPDNNSAVMQKKDDQGDSGKKTIEEKEEEENIVDESVIEKEKDFSTLSSSCLHHPPILSLLNASLPLTKHSPFLLSIFSASLECVHECLKPRKWILCPPRIQCDVTPRESDLVCNRTTTILPSGWNAYHLCSYLGDYEALRMVMTHEAELETPSNRLLREEHKWIEYQKRGKNSKPNSVDVAQSSDDISIETDVSKNESKDSPKEKSDFSSFFVISPEFELPPLSTLHGELPLSTCMCAHDENTLEYDHSARANVTLSECLPSGRTPLHISSFYCYCDVIRLLLRAGASVFEEDGEGNCCLHHMLSSSNPYCMGCLYSPDVLGIMNEKGEGLHDAVNKGIAKIIKEFKNADRAKDGDLESNLFDEKKSISIHDESLTSHHIHSDSLCDSDECKKKEGERVKKMYGSGRGDRGGRHLCMYESSARGLREEEGKESDNCLLDSALDSVCLPSVQVLEDGAWEGGKPLGNSVLVGSGVAATPTSTIGSVVIDPHSEKDTQQSDSHPEKSSELQEPEDIIEKEDKKESAIEDSGRPLESKELTTTTSIPPMLPADPVTSSIILSQPLRAGKHIFRIAKQFGTHSLLPPTCEHAIDACLCDLTRSTADDAALNILKFVSLWTVSSIDVASSLNGESKSSLHILRCCLGPSVCAMIEVETEIGTKKFKKMVNMPNSHGITPLSVAAASLDPRSVAFLLSRGADPNSVDNRGMSAMHYTCRARESKALSLYVSAILLVCGADPDARSREDVLALDGFTAVETLALRQIGLGGKRMVVADGVAPFLAVARGESSKGLVRGGGNDGTSSSADSTKLSNAKECCACLKKFGILRKKRLCMRCKNVFCEPCTSELVEMPHKGYEKPVHVCRACAGLVRARASLGLGVAGDDT
ncbi:hypothetical protein ADUPG1_011899 [Aduncisulcus paluster]|uniref:FYVE-type domain-containing protein n=1 Tax=Aduncisulcus paluster TaxID=2918883 RepID=A0ABQ5K2F0_9EUKA|nr:hypothetical protein ADUPG1_011899 [Aduncisulcus paluster]